MKWLRRLFRLKHEPIARGPWPEGRVVNSVDDMQWKDPEHYKLVGPMPIHMGLRIWRMKHPEDFADVDL